MRVVYLVSLCLTISCGSASAQVVRQEPALGQLKPGQRVLVDDGSCPAGQIKEVIGGDHISVGGKARVLRKRKCIPR